MTAAACYKLSGEWDFARRDELQAILRAGESLDEVFLDFSAVTFIDASVLGSLMRLRRRMIEHNRLGAIRIMAASRHVIRVLEICELLELFGLAAPHINAGAADRVAKRAAVPAYPFATASGATA